MRARVARSLRLEGVSGESSLYRLALELADNLSDMHLSVDANEEEIGQIDQTMKVEMEKQENDMQFIRRLLVSQDKAIEMLVDTGVLLEGIALNVSWLYFALSMELTT